MLFNNASCLGGVHLNVGGLFLAVFKYLNNRLKLADAYAARLRNGYLVLKTCLVYFLNKGVKNRSCARNL